MATFRKRASGSWEAIIRRAGVLPRAVSLTFDDEETARRVCARIEALLDQGIVPPELQREERDSVSSLGPLIRDYLHNNTVTHEDEQILTSIFMADGSMSLAKLDYDWAEAWIKSMKREKNLAPSTIRKYVGALARCCDWGANKGVAGVLTHPLRRLPRGYSSYNREDQRFVQRDGKEAKRDEERDRRLSAAEEAAVEKVFDGWAPPDKERGLRTELREDKRDLFHLALDSCMRLREMATLTEDQVDFEGEAVNLDRTKNGDKRQVPIMTDRMDALLRRRCEAAGKGGRLFPWWNGKLEAASLRDLSNRVSHQFATVFDLAGAADFRFHDLRHEGVSRLFEQTSLNDTEIARITGHRDPRQLRRYTHLRPSRVASKIRAMRRQEVTD